MPSYTKTNEIPVLPTRLEPLSITGQVVTADALHTMITWTFLMGARSSVSGVE